MTSLVLYCVLCYVVALFVLPCLIHVTQGTDTPGVSYMYYPMYYLYSKWNDSYIITPTRISYWYHTIFIRKHN